MTNFKNHFIEKAGLLPAEFEEIANLVTVRRYPKGAILLRPGEVCHHSFFVEKGLLRAYTIDLAGKEHIIQFAPENWFVSDRSSSYFGQPTDFFIDAIEDTTAVLLTQDFNDRASDISTAYRRYNELALQNHIRRQQLRINSLLGATAESRYIDFVSQYPDITQRVPQWMIASYLGITPESLSRVRRELGKKHVSGER